MTRLSQTKIPALLRDGARGIAGSGSTAAG
jgi:hypothetical protein